MRRVLFMLLLILLVSSSSAQDVSASHPEWISFTRHLSASKRYKDALYALDLIPGGSLNAEVLMLKGKNLLSLGEPDSALTFFSEALVRNDVDQIRSKVILHYNHCSIITGKPLILDVSASDHSYLELLHLQEMASALKRKDLDEFDILFSKLKCKNSDLAMIEFNLYLISHELRGVKKKSPFLAGLLSALLPGAGKIYAGKPHEALNAFLPVAFNYAQAAEGFIKREFKSPHFYFFGGVGSVFYLSNIYGSSRAVKRKYQERLLKLENKIDNELARLYSHY